MVELYLLMAVPFGLGGLVVIGIAEAGRRRAVSRRRRATAQAEARVVERLVKIEKLGRRSAPQYIYEFSVRGISRRAQYAGRRDRKKGDVLTVFYVYDPDDPEMIYIPEAQSWAGTVALYFIGAVWLMGGIMLFSFGILGIK